MHLSRLNIHLVSTAIITLLPQKNTRYKCTQIQNTTSQKYKIQKYKKYNDLGVQEGSELWMHRLCSHINLVSTAIIINFCITNIINITNHQHHATGILWWFLFWVWELFPYVGLFVSIQAPKLVSQNWPRVFSIWQRRICVSGKCWSCEAAGKGSIFLWIWKLIHKICLRFQIQKTHYNRF